MGRVVDRAKQSSAPRGKPSIVVRHLLTDAQFFDLALRQESQKNYSRSWAISTLNRGVALAMKTQSRGTITTIKDPVPLRLRLQSTNGACNEPSPD
jgi:hypothetical protein